MSARPAQDLSRVPSVKRAHIAALLTAMSGLAPFVRAELPALPTVVHGDVAINTAGRQMTVNQTTRYGIVNWNSFSVGSGNSVRFNNGSGATLNRVTGLSASRIDGTVSATGSLFLLNRNGIILGSDGRILTGGDFVGSTRDMSDADFLDGGDFTLFGDSKAGLTNLGKISATGGNILLAGYTVNNSGSLEAPAGRVGLAAGGRIDVLTDAGWLNGAYGVSLGERGNDVTNEGRIQSLAAELRAHAGNIYALAGNNTGLIQATGVRNEGGRVILTADGGTVQSSGVITATRADASGTVNGGDIEITAVSVENYGGTQDVSGATGGTINLTAASITTDTEMLARGTTGAGGTINLSASRELLFTSAGKIDASGITAGGTVSLLSGPGVNILSGTVTATSADGLGGTVNLLGSHVSLLGASVDASGFSVGGTIHVGGGYQGALVGGQTNASRTYVSDKTTLRAEATGTHGDGGTVVAWADGTTEFAGKIFARSGLRSGDGGTVETSGLGALGVSGTVDASARGIGANGQWLLDPKNITIGPSASPALNEFQRFTQSVGTTTGRTSFGADVDSDGTTYIISDAHFGDSSSTSTSNLGRIYVYENGSLAAALAGGFGTGFGTSISISGDRVATASLSTSGGTPLSRIFLFDKGAAWRNGTANLASTHDDSSRIQSVALDGTTLAYGAPQAGPNSLGKVVVFTNIGSGLTSPVTLRNPDGVAGTADNFGHAIALSGNTLAANRSERPFSQRGQPDAISNYDVYLFENLTGNWAAATSTRLVGRDNNGFGYSLGLDNNTLVVGYQRDGLGNQSPGVNVYERSSTWAAATTPAARLVAPTIGFSRPTNFGFDVDVRGDTIAISSTNWFEDSIQTFIGNDSAPFTPVYVYQRGDGWRSGSTNLVASLVPATNVNRVPFGARISLHEGGLLASAVYDSNASTLSYPVYSFAGPFDLSSRATFAAGPGADLTISAASLAASLSVGTDVTLQANNDITISSAITVNNTLGDGGDLRLEAGRRILVNASITTDNGDLTLVANASGANPTFRDPGERVVVLGRDSANASVTLSLGTGDLVIAAADRFENRSGASNPFRFATTNPGRYLVYSTTPDQTGAPDATNLFADLGTVGRDWVYYNRAFNPAAPIPADLPAGDGFLYSVQPTVGISIGDASITYGQIIVPALGLSSLTLGGTPVSGEVFGIGATDLAPLVQVNTTASVPFSAGGFAHAGTYLDSITATARSLVSSGRVFGVNVVTSGVGDLVVAKKTLAVRPADVSRTYRDPNPVFTLNYTGLVTGDTADVIDTPLTVSTVAGLTSDVGGYNIVAAGGADDNYAISITAPGRLTITQRDLPVSGLTGLSRVYNGDASSMISILSGTPTVSPLGDDEVFVDDPTNVFGRVRISFDDKNVGENKPLTISGFALTGAQSGNYRAVGPFGLTASITPATLSLRNDFLVPRNKVYDGTTTAVVDEGRLLRPVLGDDQVTLAGTAVYSFEDKNVGTNKRITLSGLTLAGRDAANYVFDSSVSLFANITPAPLEISAPSVPLRVYDGTANVQFSGPATVTPFLDDEVSLLGTASGTFADKNVGFDKIVSLSIAGLSLSGPDATNYVLRAPSHPIYGTVTPATLTVEVDTAFYRAIPARRYDGTLVATPTSPASITPLGDDDLILGGTELSSHFVNKNAGTNKLFFLPTYTLSGADAANYTFVQPADNFFYAEVTRAPLTLSGVVAQSKVYDFRLDATVTGTPSIDGILPGDDAALDASAFTYRFLDRNVGTAKPILISGIYDITGADRNNYDVETIQGSLTADITPAPLVITGARAVNRVYNGSVTVALAGGTLSGVLANDATLIGTDAIGTLADKNVGTARPVTVSGYTLGGVGAANYTLTQPTGLTATITPFGLNLVGLSADKIYDQLATTTLTATGLDAVFAGDLVSPDFSTVTATFPTADVLFDGRSRPRPVTFNGLIGLTGADAANYTVAQPAPGSVTGTISPRPITVTGLTALDRDYNGFEFVNITGTGTLVGILPGDTLAIGSAQIFGDFADRHVGIDKSVVLRTIGLTGPQAANYVVDSPLGLTASVFPRELKPTFEPSSTSRVYDGTNTIAYPATRVNGIFGMDQVVFDGASGIGTFADKSVGNNRPITLSGVTLSGPDARNYFITYPTDRTASIQPRRLELVNLTGDKIYDGESGTTLRGELSGTIAGDDITPDFSRVQGTLFDNGRFARNVGTGYTVGISGSVRLSGRDVANYTLGDIPLPLFGSITPRTLDIFGYFRDKTYDGTVDVVAYNDPLIGSGKVQFDDVTLNTSGFHAEFADANAGAEKSLIVTGLSLTGAHAANYTIRTYFGFGPRIDPKRLTVTGLTALDRVYDRTNLATIIGTGVLEGVLPGETITLDESARFGEYSDKSVDPTKTLEVRGLALVGDTAANYTIRAPRLVAAITPATVTLTGLTVQDRIYDSTADALVSGVAALDFGPLNGVLVESEFVSLEGTASFSFADKHVGVNKPLVVTGLSLGGDDAFNYTFVIPSTLAATISPRPITVSGLTIADKTYDGTRDGQISGTGTFGGVLLGDDLAIDVGAVDVSFADRHAGVDKAVTLSGVTLSGRDAGNYTAATPSGLTATIFPKNISVAGLAALDRVYDRTSVATITGSGALQGLVSGDTVTLDQSALSGLFADKNVGVDKPVSIRGLALLGAQAGNYQLTAPALTASITPATATITGLVALDRSYDTTTDVAFTGVAALDFGSLNGVLASAESVTLSGSATGSFADKNAGAAKPVSIAGLSLSGDDAANYRLATPAGLTATIAPLPVTVSGLTALDKTYDGTRAAAFSGTAILGGAFSSDQVSLDLTALAASFADKNVGLAKPVTFTGLALAGDDARNYTASIADSSADILAKQLTVSGFSALDRVYDRTAAASFTGVGTLLGTVGDDVVTLVTADAAASFADKHVGTAKPVTLTGLALTGADAANYTVAAPAGLRATIIPAFADVTGLSAVDRTYDTTTTAPLAGAATLGFGSLDGVLASAESVALSGIATGSFADKNAGPAKAVTITGLSLTGDDAGNYVLRLPNTLTATVDRAALGLAGVAVSDRVYDTTVSATFLSRGTIAPLGADQVVLDTTAATAAFATTQAGVAKSVALSGYALTGDDAANYVLALPADIRATINPATLLVGGLFANSRTYDGTLTATFGGSASISPLGFDVVTLAGSPRGSFADENAGLAKPVTLTGLSLAGADAANYTLVSPAFSADIARRTLVVSGLTGRDRIYDGTTVTTVTGAATFSNLVTSDIVTFDPTAITAVFADKNIGFDKLLTLSGQGLRGRDADNYLQRLPDNLFADIAAKELSVIGADAVDRPYDRTFDVALQGGALAGTIAGDEVDLVTSAAVGVVTDRNANPGPKPVIASGYSLAGADSINYVLRQPVGIDVLISPRPLQISGIRVADKIFDGTTTAIISGGNLSGVLSGDAVGLVTTSGRATFADPAVGLGKPVFLSGFALSGADARNYTLPAAPAVSGNILTALRLITDVVPPEVLRASSATASEQRRAALVAAASAQPDSVKITDYTDSAAQLSLGIAIIPKLPKTLRDLAANTPTGAAYLIASDEAYEASLRAVSTTQAYRSAAAAHKQLGQQANANARAIEVETALLETLSTRVARADAELAKADANLATLAEAKRRIDTLTRQTAEAARLGRGSEAAQYDALIAEARALVAREAEILAQRAALAGEAAQARAALAANNAKVEALAAEKTRLADAIAKSATALDGLQSAATVARSAAADTTRNLEAFRSEAERAAIRETEEAAAALARLQQEAPTPRPFIPPDRIDAYVVRSPALLEKEFPLTPERRAALRIAEENAATLEKITAELAAQSAAAEARLRASRVTNPAITSERAVDTAIRGLSSEQIAALDFGALDLPDRVVLPDRDPAVRNLNNSAKALTDRLSELGSLSIVRYSTLGTPLSAFPVETSAPVNVSYDSTRRVADLDRPTTFAPDVERGLKSELVRAGALMDFSGTPEIAALPVATQLQLQSALRDYVAKTQQGFDANGEAVKTLHDAGGEIATMLLMEAFETYGLENIPGLESSVGKSISAFTQGLAKIGDARNPEEGFKQFGNAIADAGKAFGQGMSDAFTGDSDEARKERAEAAAKAAEDRRRNIFYVASDLMRLESDRVAAVAARDRNLEEAKQVLVTRKLTLELDKQLSDTRADLSIAQQTKISTTREVYRDQIIEVQTSAASAEQTSAAEIAAALAAAERAASTASALADAKAITPR